MPDEIIQMRKSDLKRAFLEWERERQKQISPEEWISVAEFRKRTKLSYGKVRTMYETTCPQLFEMKQGKQRRVNYTLYKQTA